MEEFRKKFVRNGHVIRGTWKHKKNHRYFFECLGKELGYTLQEHWYGIDKEKLIYYGKSLLRNYYCSSPCQFVKAMNPNAHFFEWRFSNVPNYFWKEEVNRKRYAFWFGLKLGYLIPEHWYQLKKKAIKNNYGGGLLANYYSDSPIKFVRDMFPKYQFYEWMFSNTTNAFWKEEVNRKQYANWLGRILGYTCPEHWYQVTFRLVVDNRGAGLLRYYSNSPSTFVKEIFPEYPWVSTKFKKSYSRGQIQWLEYLMVSTPDIRYALHEGGEMKIPNSRYLADGYSEVENCIYEYHGDFWHGNPLIYPSLEINPVSKVTYGELYEKTLKKQKHCEEECGYRYYFVWESEWIRGKIAVMNLQRKFRKKKN